MDTTAATATTTTEQSAFDFLSSEPTRDQQAQQPGSADDNNDLTKLSPMMTGSTTRSLDIENTLNTGNKEESGFGFITSNAEVSTPLDTLGSEQQQTQINSQFQTTTQTQNSEVNLSFLSEVPEKKVESLSQQTGK